MRLALTMMLAMIALPASAVEKAQVVFLGEQHDNPHHHVRQAEIVTQLAPAAIVWEMLTSDQAALVTVELASEPTALESVLGWNASGWPDFDMYAPIFAAAPNAVTYGAAVPRDAARAAMADIAGTFGDQAAQFGLNSPLPEDQQAAREALQMTAHCDALPIEMLSMMVNVQRLRDAELARVSLRALIETGGPVVVITGNGHARADWGAPAILSMAAPDVTWFALGQGEAESDPIGTFDRVEYSPAVEREDPCAAFLKSRSD